MACKCRTLMGHLAVLQTPGRRRDEEYSLAWPPVVALAMAATSARPVPVAAAFCTSRMSATAAAASTTLLPFLAAASPAHARV